MKEINLSDIKKLFPNKKSIIGYYLKQGIIKNFKLGLVFPDYSPFDFGFFLEVLTEKRKVLIILYNSYLKLLLVKFMHLP